MTDKQKPDSSFDAYCKRVDKHEEKIRQRNEHRTTNKFIAHLCGQYPDVADKQELLNKYVPKLSPYQRKCRYRKGKVK